MKKHSKKVLFTATVDSHILHFHIPYLKMFKNAGYEVHVATNGNEIIPYCDVKHIVTFEREPFNMNNLRAIKQLERIIEQEQFDIVHCHTPMGSVVTRLAAKHSRKVHGTRIIYTAHGFHFYKGASIKNWMLFYPVEKLLSYITDDLITINGEDYEAAKKKMKAKRIHYVPGVGVDPEKFNFEMAEEEKEKLRKEIGVSKDDFVMIYPAELSKRKNQGMLIKVMTELKKENAKYKLLLPGQDSMNGYYQQMAKKLGVEDCVKFLGYRKDVSKLFKISNIAVSAARQEGLPVNIMEAQMCGLPCVVTNCRGNRDLVHDGVNGYVVEIDDVDSLKNAILKLYESKINVKLDEQFTAGNIEEKMRRIYWNSDLKKNKVALLRTTSIINDSRVTKEVNTFLKNGLNVKVVCWDRNGIVKNENKLSTSSGEAELVKYNLKADYGSGLKNLFKMLRFEIWLYKTLKKERNNYDIIHSCDLDTGIVANMIAKKYNKKLVYDIFDYYVDCHNLPNVLRGVIEKQEIKVINNADTTIICGEWRKEQIGKSNPKNLLIIHNSPDIDMEKIEKSETVVKSNSNKIKVAYVGVLQDDRLLKEVAEELKNNKDIELHIGGFGKYEQYFEELSKENDNIFFYGSMKYDDVLKLESECDVLFATYNPEIKNHKYSAPNKVYEAMALSKPIIVCNGTGIDKFVLKNNLGIAVDYDATSFLDGLRNLNCNCKNESQKLFSEKYSWNKMEKLIEQIYL